MYLRHMSAWMLYVVQTSFSRQATPPTPQLSSPLPPFLQQQTHSHLPYGMNGIQKCWQQASANWKVLNIPIKSFSLFCLESSGKEACLFMSATAR